MGKICKSFDNSSDCSVDFLFFYVWIYSSVDCQYVCSRNDKEFWWMARAGLWVLFVFFFLCLPKIPLISRCCLLRFLSWAPLPFTSLPPTTSVSASCFLALKCEFQSLQETPGLQGMSLACPCESCKEWNSVLVFIRRHSSQGVIYPLVEGMKSFLDDQKLWLLVGLGFWRLLPSPSTLSPVLPLTCLITVSYLLLIDESRIPNLNCEW